MRSIFIVIMGLCAFLGDVYAIEDEDLTIPPAGKYGDDNFAIRTLERQGIHPLTAQIATQEVDDFANASVETQKRQIKSYFKDLSYLVLVIASDFIDDKGRAVMRKKIWNRISLLRLFSDPVQFKMKEDLLSLTSLYDNLSRITKESVDALAYDKRAEDPNKRFAAYAKLTVDCQSFHDRLMGGIPLDLREK